MFSLDLNKIIIEISLEVVNRRVYLLRTAFILLTPALEASSF